MIPQMECKQRKVAGWHPKNWTTGKRERILRALPFHGSHGPSMEVMEVFYPPIPEYSKHACTWLNCAGNVETSRKLYKRCQEHVARATWDREPQSRPRK